MKYAKTRDVHSISRGTSRSAGIDFYVPYYSDSLMKDILLVNSDSTQFQQIKLMNENIDDKLTSLIIPAHTHMLIPSGIKIDLANYRMISGFFQNDSRIGFALIAHNKSSIGKQQLDVAATVVDEDFQGEIHLSVTNTSGFAQKIAFGQKLEQFLLVPVIIDELLETKLEDMFSIKSERCENGFGSTN